MKYFLFIGRWAPLHKGHQYIIDSFVNNNNPVCIAVRDSKEIYTAEQRKQMIESVYEKEIKEDKVKVIVIPDIEGICVGRGVGYSLIEVPQKIKVISGTGIRKGVCNDVDSRVKNLMEKFRK